MKTGKKILVLAMAAVLAGPLAAQEDKNSTVGMQLAQAGNSESAASQGMVRGRVIDTARGSYLNGALVRVVGANREVRTNREGMFSLSGMSAGSYQLEVDYLGFDTATIEVVVSAGQTSEVEVAMQDASVALGVMQISAIRDIQSRSLNQQRASDNIVNVVSADSIGRFPDGNVAEALSRVPGVTVERDQGEGRYINVRGTPTHFNAVAVDGVILPAPDGGTRAIDLDTIPTDIVASLEVTKALTPDLDADSIGGHINIVTQSAFDEDERILRGTLGYGQNELGGGDNQRLSLTAGDVFADGKVGLLLSASHTRTNRNTDNVENAWVELDGQVLSETTEIKDYEVTRERNALNARLDYRPNDRTSLYFGAMHAKFIDDEYRHNMILEYDDYADGSTQTSGTFLGTDVYKELRHRKVENTIEGFSAGGEHSFDNFDVDFSLSTAKATQDYPTRNYLIYTLNRTVDLPYDFSDPNTPTWYTEVGENNFNYDPNDYDVEEYEVRKQSSEDTDNSAAANLSFPFMMAGADAHAQFGVKMRSKSKELTNTRFNYDGGVFDGTPSLSDVTTGEPSGTLDEYLTGERFNQNTMDKYGHVFESHPDFEEVLRRKYASDYKAKEDIQAVYGMSTFDWGSTRVVGGIRIEQTSTDSEAYRYDRDTDEVTLQKDSNSYTNAFPSIHLRQELSGNTVMRASYTTGLNRPELSDIAPAVVERSNRLEADEGNPDLKPTYAHNLDLMLEHYIRPLGLLSGGVFYKKLDDVIFGVNANVERNGEMWRISRQDNGDSGKVYGFELNWEQGLSFLPAPLDSLGIFLNYTHASSDADLPDGSGTTRLPGQSDRAYNAALYYERSGFNMRLSYNYRSEFVDSVSARGRHLDTWWDARSQVDLTGSYQLTDAIQLYAEAMNLTDTAQNRYIGDSSRVSEREKFGRFYQAGVRMNF